MNQNPGLYSFISMYSNDYGNGKHIEKFIAAFHYFMTMNKFEIRNPNGLREIIPWELRFVGGFIIYYTNDNSEIRCDFKYHDDAMDLLLRNGPKSHSIRMEDGYYMKNCELNDQKIDDLMRLYKSALHKVTPNPGRRSGPSQTESYRSQQPAQALEHYDQSYGFQQDSQSASSNNGPYDSGCNVQSPSSQTESYRSQQPAQALEYYDQSYGFQQNSQSTSSNNGPYDSGCNVQSTSSHNQWFNS